MMTDIMRRARERAEQFGVRHVLVATNSGDSVRKALGVFGPRFHMYAVGNPASAHAQGLVLHHGISEGARKTLESMGIVVVLADQSLFQRPHLSLAGAPLSEVVEGVSPAGHVSALSVIYSVLQWLGDGPRVCVEIALMAADAGVLSR